MFSLNQRVIGEPLNSFYRDMLAMLLTWSAKTPPDPSAEDITTQASAIVDHIIQNVLHVRKDITKANMVTFLTIYCLIL